MKVMGESIPADFMQEVGYTPDQDQVCKLDYYFLKKYRKQAILLFCFVFCFLSSFLTNVVFLLVVYTVVTCMCWHVNKPQIFKRFYMCANLYLFKGKYAY